MSRRIRSITFSDWHRRPLTVVQVPGRRQDKRPHGQEIRHRARDAAGRLCTFDRPFTIGCTVTGTGAGRADDGVLMKDGAIPRIRERSKRLGSSALRSEEGHGYRHKCARWKCWLPTTAKAGISGRMEIENCSYAKDITSEMRMRQVSPTGISDRIRPREF